ncbi:SDR family NAD(P)-dependent oxidoreductase [candidate division KSB1 bacterium]|nr:SDR family NAD(P)-dependent oxidoreductase [candidate division KSB1 bacterium]
MRLNGKTVLLTGASSGIGYECAQRLAEKGCRLILIARRGEILKQLISQLPAYSEPHIYYSADLSSEADIRNVCQKIISANIPVDILFLNAGVGTGKYSSFEIDYDKVLYTFKVNFFSIVLFVKYFLPVLKKQRQSMIAVNGSIAGYRGLPASASYSSSKAALMNFIESLRIDLWNTNIKCVLISPGFVKTPLIANNKFFMPFLMSVDKAAKIIVRGMEKEKPEISFPFWFVLIAKVARLLPHNFYAKIMYGRR